MVTSRVRVVAWARRAARLRAWLLFCDGGWPTCLSRSRHQWASRSVRGGRACGGGKGDKGEGIEHACQLMPHPRWSAGASSFPSRSWLVRDRLHAPVERGRPGLEPWRCRPAAPPRYHRPVGRAAAALPPAPPRSLVAERPPTCWAVRAASAASATRPARTGSAGRAVRRRRVGPPPGLGRAKGRREEEQMRPG